MSLNSINTNNAAYVALQSLNTTLSSLQSVQKKISTGYRVSDATDDGAAFAVAQRVRSDVGALTSANEQLGGAKGLLGVTTSALTGISNTLATARSALVKLADTSVVGAERAQYKSQYASLLSSVHNNIADAAYNGKTLIGNVTGSAGSYGGVALIRNEVGATYGVAAFSGTAFFASVNIAGAALTTAAAAAAITATGVFLNAAASVTNQLNTYGAASNYVDSQSTFNNNKIDSLNSGLGALIDADLTKESANLQALQVRQQLGTQALSIANQAPQSLLSLFK